MAKIVTLHPREAALADPDTAADAAGPALEGDLEDLAAELSRIGLAYRGGRFADLRRGLDRAVRLADRAGLPKVAAAAATVAEVSRTADAAALAATLARLMRLGDGALCTLWDLQDRRI
ncbi:hypothetical protein DXV76_13295 [Rhodobacteraceae bacterium CCMM004]|nr:hypothetical protein DXV76_13295 [Rhodobacteraceae bacterium CCMM004]